MSLPRQSEIKKEIFNLVTEGRTLELDESYLQKLIVDKFELSNEVLKEVFEKSGRLIIESRLNGAMASLVRDGVLIKSEKGVYLARRDTDDIGPEPEQEKEKEQEQEQGSETDHSEKDLSNSQKTERTKSRAIVRWVSSNQTKGMMLAAFLLFWYMVPILLFIYAAWKTEGFMEPNFVLGWLSSFLNSSDAILSDFHKVLLPIISAISVVSLKDKPSNSVLLFSAVVFLGFLVSVGLHVYLGADDIKNALRGLPRPIDTHLLNSFILRVQETLLMYFMMLVGIHVSNSMTGEKNA